MFENTNLVEQRNPASLRSFNAALRLISKVPLITYLPFSGRSIHELLGINLTDLFIGGQYLIYVGGVYSTTQRTSHRNKEEFNKDKMYKSATPPQLHKAAVLARSKK